MAQKTVSYVNAIAGGTFGSATQVPVVTVSTQGAVTAVSNTAITYPTVPGATSVVLTRTAATVFAVGDTVAWTVVSDPGTMYNGGTGGAGGTAAITIPTTGNYIVAYTLVTAGGSSGLKIQKNGATDYIRMVCTTNNPNGASSMVQPFTAGDTLKVICTVTFTAGTTAGDWSWSVTKVS